MDVVLTVPVVSKLMQRCAKCNESMADIVKYLQKLLVDGTVPHFLTMCMNYLTVDRREHAEVYDVLKTYFDGPNKWNRNNWRIQKPLLQSKEDALFVLLYFVNKNDKVVARKAPVMDVMVRLGEFIRKWYSHKPSSWRELPVSMYRAMECYIEPTQWIKFPRFKRYNKKIPQQLYSTFSPMIYLESQKKHKHKTPSKVHRPEDKVVYTHKEKKVQSMSLAAYIIIKSHLKQSDSTRCAYSRLCDCLSTGNDEYGEDWLKELASHIQSHDPNSLFFTLHTLLSNMTDQISMNQKNCSSRYYLRSTRLVHPSDTPIRNLPHELRAFIKLHKRTNGRLRVLQCKAKNTSMLSLHSTMNKLRQTYKPLQLSTDYVIYRDDDFIYLALSKDDHKMITNILLPHLRINGHFQHSVLPVFLHVADGLLNGNQLEIHQSLQSVYDLVVGWASKQAYFKTVRSKKLLRSSVRLLCKYAACFSSPNELFIELILPYREHNDLSIQNKSVEVVYAMKDMYCPQETIRAIIMLDVAHHIEWTTFCDLRHVICEEKIGKHVFEQYTVLKKWIQKTYSERSSAAESEVMTLRRKPFDTLYDYLLDDRIFTSKRSRHYCEAIRVRSSRSSHYKTSIPAQTPGLKLARKLETDEEAALAYQNHIKVVHDRHVKRSMSLQECETEKLCMMLQQLEYVRLCSPVLESDDYRGKIVDPPEYINIHAMDILEDAKAHIPFTMNSDYAIQSCKQLFPIYSCCYYGSEVPNKVLHTADPEILVYMLHNPLPTSICCKRARSTLLP